MSGATSKVSQLEKVVALLAPLLGELDALPGEGTAQMCTILTPKLSTVMGSIAAARPQAQARRPVLSSPLRVPLLAPVAYAGTTFW